MNKKLGRLLYPQTWIYFVVMGLFALGAFWMKQYVLGGVEAAATVIAYIVFITQKRSRHKEIQHLLNKINHDQNGVDNVENPFPTAVIRMGDGTILLSNDQFAQATGYTEGLSQLTISEVVPGFTVEWMITGKTEYAYDVTIRDRRYRVYGTMVRAEDPNQTLLGVLRFMDLTELYQVRDEYIRSRPVVSILLIDNYEELTKNLTEGAVSAMEARINDCITHWTEEYHGLLRRLEKNRFLFVFEKRDLKHAEENKFSILEEIHRITNPSGLAASISFGLGVDGASFEESYAFASLAIEMSLSRGGDQAVIKDRYNFSFFGGRMKEADRRSKVRARVTANSLMELIGQSSQVFVMSHKNADMDSVGSAMGICCMCRKKGKKFSIVLDKENNASQRLIEEIQAVPEYMNAIISGQDALLQCDSDSVLIVVDTNRPDQVESQPLLEAISKVCVVDHHRRAADYINPVVVNFHEPYASSAAELATELLQYAVEKTDVLPIEAKALMAGLVLDTKSFNVRTGERTFEAAAYLRQLGAEPVEVKKLLQNDFQDTVAKYQIIKASRLYRQEIAISALNTSTSRVLAAQAADELLNISGITASFVLYPDGDQVVISARSIGTANVQVILEALGGGGNAATAGAQITGASVKDVLDQLVASIDRFYED